MGPRGAGHYVKMVHNGIEYGDMQLIAEVYDLLCTAAWACRPPELHDVFAEWNSGELKSYLIEITADIFSKIDTRDRPAASRADPGRGAAEGHRQVDFAERPGRGRTHPDHQRRGGEPHPLQPEGAARGGQPGACTDPQPAYKGNRQALIDAARDALYASKVTSYAQGLGLLRIASDEYKYDLKPGEIAKIWRAGCIIRAGLLGDIMAAYQRHPGWSTCCWTSPSASPSKAARTPGARACRRPWAWASRSWPWAPRWPTSTPTAASACRPT